MNEQLGRQTYRLERPPVAVSWANIGGRQEEAGPLSPYFDELDQDSFFGEKTWEKAESAMQKRALGRALEKGGLKAEDIDAVFAGDLLNQCIGTSFRLRHFALRIY